MIILHLAILLLNIVHFLYSLNLKIFLIVSICHLIVYKSKVFKKFFNWYHKRVLNEDDCVDEYKIDRFRRSNSTANLRESTLFSDED